MANTDTQPKPTQQEIVDTLVGMGKDIATRMLNDAVGTAEDEMQLRNQLMIANVVGCHLLANLAFNGERRGGMTADAWLDMQLVEIRKDVQELRVAFEKGELELKASPFEKTVGQPQ